MSIRQIKGLWKTAANSGKDLSLDQILACMKDAGMPECKRWELELILKRHRQEFHTGWRDEKRVWRPVRVD